MAAAIGLITIGGLLILSAIKGKGITDVVAGFIGDPLNPAGGMREFPVDATVTGDPITTSAGKIDTGNILAGSTSASVPTSGKFPAGPHPELLQRLYSMAQAYGLTITATTNGNHVPGSYHFLGRAFDAAGSEANMQRFASAVVALNNSTHAVTELIHNPGFGIKNGQNVNGAVVFAAVWLGHRDHVHVAV